MIQRETIEGFTYEMDYVAGGMFVQVRVFMVDGPRVYSFSHQTMTAAELDYARQKDGRWLEQKGLTSRERRILDILQGREPRRCGGWLSGRSEGNDADCGRNETHNPHVY